MTFKLVNEFSKKETTDAIEEEEEEQTLIPDPVEPPKTLESLGLVFEDVKIDKNRNKKKDKEPYMEVSFIDPMGLMTLKFNQDFMVPKNWREIDYSAIIQMQLRSTGDGSVVNGTYVTNPESRLLKE